MFLVTEPHLRLATLNVKGYTSTMRKAWIGVGNRTLPHHQPHFCLPPNLYSCGGMGPHKWDLCWSLLSHTQHNSAHSSTIQALCSLPQAWSFGLRLSSGLQNDLPGSHLSVTYQLNLPTMIPAFFQVLRFLQFMVKLFSFLFHTNEIKTPFPVSHSLIIPTLCTEESICPSNIWQQ